MKLAFVSPSVAASKSSFWEGVASDLPSLLTEGDYGDPHVPTIPRLQEINDQTLAQHPAYKQLLLVRNTFQSFDRKDGKSSGPFASQHAIDSMYQAIC